MDEQERKAYESALVEVYGEDYETNGQGTEIDERFWRVAAISRALDRLRVEE